MPGPPKKPHHLKVVAGTQRRDREPGRAMSVPPLDVAPEPPDWLPNAHAVKAWQRLAPILVANKILSELDLETLGHLCAVHGKVIQIWAAGETPTGHLIAQYKALASAFGLAQGWRGKVGLLDESKKNPFSRFKPDQAD